MDYTKNAIRNIVWGLINNFVIILIPLINRTIIIHFLGSEFMGLDGLFTSILQMLNIAELGFSTAIVFSMYKPIAEKDSDTICALLSLYQRVYRIIGMVILLIGVSIIPILPKLIHGNIPDGINLYVLYLIFLGNTVLGYWMFAYKKSLILAHQRVDILSNIDSIVRLMGIGIQLVILLILKNYYYYILVMPLLTLADNFSVEYISKKLFPQYFCKGELSQEIKQDIWKRIKGLMIQKVCVKSRNSMDNIIISTFLGLLMVTAYGNYYCIMGGITSILGCFTSAIRAGVGQSIVINSAEENHQNMLRFNFMYMWMSGVIVTILICIYQPLIALWVGESNLLPFYVTCAICVYFYSLCMGDVLSLYSSGAGLWWEGRYRGFVEAIMNIFLNIFLGKLWGVFGVVLATNIYIIIVNFLYGSTIVYRFYFKNKKIFLFYRKHLLYSIVALISSIISYSICDKVTVENFWGICIRCIISFVISNSVFWFLLRKQKEYYDSMTFVQNFLKDKIKK